MKGPRVVIRSLRFHWKTGTVVAFGVAVATAVIVGSLLVGDSVRGSIRDVAVSRLGAIDYAMQAPRFFGADLAAKLAESSLLKGRVRRLVPAIIQQGSVTSEPADASKTGTTVPEVNVIGVDGRFWELFPDGPAVALKDRQAAVNAAAARDLGISKGGVILVTVGKTRGARADTAFALRKREQTTVTLRLEVGAVLPDSGAGDFTLNPGTAVPRNVFVSREWLARQTGKEGQANAILVQSAPDDTNSVDALRSTLRSVATLADLGLKLRANEKLRYVSAESASLLLGPQQVQAALDAARGCGAEASRISVYLADSICVAGRTKGISYAMVAGVEPAKPPAQEDDFIFLNSWAASDLDARDGQEMVVTYPVPSRDGSYRTQSVTLKMRGVLPLAGVAADRGLVPEIEGITDADKVSEWDLPFAVDMRRIGERDEQYWNEHGATPKAFVSLSTVRQMWLASGSLDWVTSVRAAVPAGKDLAAFPDAYAEALRSLTAPEDAGLVFRPVREAALAASQGSTDFGVLFLSMSMFLVASGAGLAGMLMRLSVEQRASELGILLATGFTERSATRLIRWEGVALVVAGAVAGVPLGVLYASGILRALQSWWADAAGGAVLWLHVDMVSIVAGFLAGLLAGLLSIWWGVRRLHRRKVLELLSGWRAIEATGRGRGERRVVLAVTAGCVGAAGALAVLAGGYGLIAPAKAFFGAGAALLVAGLATCYLLLSSQFSRRGPVSSLFGLALRSAGTHLGRSMLAIGLLASAAFVLVTVGANGRGFGQMNAQDRKSGTGGFSLRAESSLPVHYDFGTASGRAQLGFPASDEPLFKDVKVVSFLLASGEDASCLNLAGATSPRLLGVGVSMAGRDAFTVETGHSRPAGNPWQLLARPQAERGEAEAAAFADAETAMWRLHKGLGDTMTVPDGSGRPVTLRLGGLLSTSILASELLVSEDDFRRMYPAETSPRYFLIETPPDMEQSVAEALRRNLGQMGLEVRSTREILDNLVAVQNTYLMTFLALGGLGAVLGSVGLVVVLLRNALERRGEFALMLATGFRRPYLAGLLVVENAMLLAGGLVCGAAAALAAAAPQLSSVDSRVNWSALAALLLAIMSCGLIACGVAAACAVRKGLIEALRAE